MDGGAFGLSAALMPRRVSRGSVNARMDESETARIQPHEGWTQVVRLSRTLAPLSGRLPALPYPNGRRLARTNSRTTGVPHGAPVHLAAKCPAVRDGVTLCKWKVR